MIRTNDNTNADANDSLRITNGNTNERTDLMNSFVA
jgi:hypothetical protein